MLMKLTHGVGNIDIVYTIGNQRKKGISLPKNESNQTDTFIVLLQCPRKGIDQAKETFLTSQLGAIHLIQRCPTLLLRSPQLWRINKAIRHIFFEIAEKHLQCLI